MKNLKKQFTCLGENIEKYITFTIPIEKEAKRIDINEEEITKNICYILQFIDSPRLMTSSLSNLVNNLCEGIHKIKYKCNHDDKKCETYRIKCKYWDWFLEYTNLKDDLIEYKCLWSCNKNYQHKFHEKLKERFFSIYKFSNRNNSKFILLLQNSVYPYEYMDNSEKFNEVPLFEKQDFYSHLNMEDITDAGYVHPKRVSKDFEIKNLGDYHLYVHSGTSLLADIFENSRNMCLKTYKLDPAKFL